MDAGLVSKWDILELSCDLTASYNRTGGLEGVSASSSFTSQWCPDYLTLTDGIILTCETAIAVSAAAGAGTGRVRLQIPDLGIDQDHDYTGGWQSSLSGRLEIDDLALYCTQSAGVIIWLLKWSEMRFYATGIGLVWTGGASELSSEYVAPAGVPLLGIPGTLGASAGVNPIPILGAGVTAGCATSAIQEYNATSEGGGGWRFKEVGSGTWQTLDVSYQDEAVPSITCDVTADYDEPTVTNTYDAVVSAYAGVSDETVAGATVSTCNTCSNGLGSGWVFTPYHRTITYEFKYNSVMLLPALTKSVKRWGDGTDYGALIGRGGLPWTKRNSTAACFDYDLSANTASGSSTTEVHPEYTDYLSKVENSAHTIEDPLGEVSYAPYQYTGFKYRGRGTCASATTPGICPSVEPEEPPADPPEYCGTVYDDHISHSVASAFVSDVQDNTGGGSNPYLLDPLYHVDDVPRYMNYVVNPHWNYQYWFPQNTIDTDGDAVDDAQDVWQVFLADIANEYWLDLRTQWISHASLPGGEDDQTRNSLVSAPLRDGALSLWMRSTWFGTETSWWGINRFKARDWSPVASKAADSDSSTLWSATDATLTHGADITVNPSALSCTVYFDLGSLTVEPYLYPHIAKQVLLDWVNTNVSALSVYLESIDGTSSVLIATTQGTYAIPTTGTDTKYAGSWKQEYGAGYITDEGGDSLVSGISSATMADTERVLAFSLLAGQQGRRLRFDITVTSHASDMTLKYPTFYAATTAPYIYQESGHQSATVWADGPGIRFGSWRWYDYSGPSELSSPVVCEPGTRFSSGHKSSVLDAIRWENLVLYSQSYDYNATTTIAALYDSVEGQTKAKAAYDTIAFEVKAQSGATPIKVGIFVNTWAEVPPLACFPVRARGTDDFNNDGSWAQEAWSFAQEPRRIVSAKEQLDIVDPDTGTTWTSLATSPSSWKITEHEHAVDNNEALFWLKHGSKKIAEGRPWHGYFKSGKQTFGKESPYYLSADVGYDKTHVVAYLNDDDNVEVSIEDHALNEIAVYDQGFTATDVHVKIDRRRQPYRIRLYTVEAGTVYVRESEDGGQTFAAAVSIGTGTRVTADIAVDGLEYVYYYAGGAIKGRRYDRAGTALEAEFTAIATADDDGVAVTAYPIAGGKHRLVLRYVVGGVKTSKYSYDGITFI